MTAPLLSTRLESHELCGFELTKVEKVKDPGNIKGFLLVVMGPVITDIAAREGFVPRIQKHLLQNQPKEQSKQSLWYL